MYYESFGDEIVAIELANPSHLLGIRSGHITNIMVGGGNVYFQDGLKIWRGNRDLSTVSLFHTIKRSLPAGLLQPAQQGRIERVRFCRLADVIIHAGCQATLAVLVEGIGGQGQNREG